MQQPAVTAPHDVIVTLDEPSLAQVRSASSPDPLHIQDELFLMAGGMSGVPWALVAVHSLWSCALGLEMFKFWGL